MLLKTINKKQRDYSQNSYELYKHSEPLTLESGEVIHDLEIAYNTYGELNPSKDNVIWVFHALTADASPTDWWNGLVGNKKVIDTSKYFVICANILGSCYGTTGPASINPNTGEVYGINFPEVTIKDIVSTHKILQSHLNISKIHLGIGGSLGGQQLLEWSSENSDLFKGICILATNAKHSAWGIAFNETQRMALETDPTFKEGGYNGGIKGLQTARAIAMLSYRNSKIYRKTQTDYIEKTDNYKASSYQRYQGVKLSKRFNPYAYYILSKAMDSHDIGRGRRSVRATLKSITSKAIVIGIKSDVLFPFKEQKFISDNIPNSRFELIDSLYGHDGFLIETTIIGERLTDFLNN